MKKIKVFLKERLFHRVLPLVFAIFVCVFTVFPVLAASTEDPITAVIDDGNLLSDEDENKMTQYIDQIAAKQGVHVLVLTVTHKEGFSNSDFGSISFAQHFYDEYVKASPIDSPGFMVMLDMENRFLYIHTSNAVIEWVSDDDCDDILDDTYDLAGEERYYDALYETIRGVDEKIDSHFRCLCSKAFVTAGGAIIPAFIVSFVCLP